MTQVRGLLRMRYGFRGFLQSEIVNPNTDMLFCFACLLNNCVSYYLLLKSLILNMNCL